MELIHNQHLEDAIFQITDRKLHVPVVTLSKENITKLLFGAEIFDATESAEA